MKQFSIMLIVVLCCGCLEVVNAKTNVKSKKQLVKDNTDEKTCTCAPCKELGDYYRTTCLIENGVNKKPITCLRGLDNIGDFSIYQIVSLNDVYYTFNFPESLIGKDWLTFKCVSGENIWLKSSTIEIKSVSIIEETPISEKDKLLQDRLRKYRESVEHCPVHAYPRY